MPSFEILLVLLLGAVAWFWLDSLKVREAAIDAARTACTVDGLMLLDDTVAVSHMAFARNENGRLTLKRTYDFEYSDTGDNRRKGSVMLVGRHVVLLNVGSREPPVVRTLH